MYAFLPVPIFITSFNASIVWFAVWSEIILFEEISSDKSNLKSFKMPSFAKTEYAVLNWYGLTFMHKS